MMNEGAQYDKKSLLFLRAAKPDWKELAKDAVCFANAYGGRILIGIEDDAGEPPAGQVILEGWPELVRKRIAENAVNVAVETRKMIAANGGEYIEVLVQRSIAVASTSDKRFYQRVGDECKPVGGDELMHLMTDKAAFTWELQRTQVPPTAAEPARITSFVKDIRASDRTTDHVKDMSETELLEYYQLVQGGHLTNLGVLWLGSQSHRSRLPNAPTVYFIKYDASERKVNKISWDDHTRDPQQLLDAVWGEVPDWREGIEVGEGIFRRIVPHYEEVVVRELVANALVHRPYTTSGAIFINLYPDRLEIHNPGLLPLGVTPLNILHQSKPRNDKLARLFHDLRLMEKEGSGYDRVYESLLTQGKAPPQVEEGDDRVTVTVRRHIHDEKTVVFLSRLLGEYQSLKRREVICLGLIAQHNGLRCSDLQMYLGLRTPELVHAWLGELESLKLVKVHGRKPDPLIAVQPAMLRRFAFGGRTTLKQIEDPRLKELIREDLRLHGGSRMDQIHERVGKEIPLRRLRFTVNWLRRKEVVCAEGATRNMKYYLCEPGKFSNDTF